MNIAPDQPRHHAAIRSLLLAAFPNAAEADLVEQLRHDGDAAISLVALDGEKLLGHILLSTMRAPMPALGLAPLAVAASHQKRGIAADLISAARTQASQLGVEALFVLGDPAYYGRFGFSAADAAGFETPYAGPHFMVCWLTRARLTTGRVDYAPAFAALS